MKRIKYYLTAAAVVASLGFVAAVGTEASAPEPAQANQGCYITYAYGSPTRTIGRESSRKNCDVQAKLYRRHPSGYRITKITHWCMYQCTASSWEGSTWTGYGRNQVRVRQRGQWLGAWLLA